jgi:hypothetical protein
MKIQKLNIGEIKLNWSDWYEWEAIKIDGRKKNGIKIPNKKSGVYEVSYKHDNNKRLTIGKASDLRFRVRQALVKGRGKHSSGKKIRCNEDVTKLIVRWAVTARPAAAEEELHRIFKNKYGKLPDYVKHT